MVTHSSLFLACPAGGHHLHLDDDTGPSVARVISEWTARVERLHPTLWTPHSLASSDAPASVAAPCPSPSAVTTDRFAAWSPLHICIAHTVPFPAGVSITPALSPALPAPVPVTAPAEARSPQLVHAPAHVLTVDRCAEPHEVIYERIGAARPSTAAQAVAAAHRVAPVADALPHSEGHDLCWVPLMPKLWGSADAVMDRARGALVMHDGKRGPDAGRHVPERDEVGFWAPRVLLETLPTSETRPVGGATTHHSAPRPLLSSQTPGSE